MTLQTSDFLKQIILLQSFNTVFEVISAVSSEKLIVLAVSILKLCRVSFIKTYFCKQSDTDTS